MPHVTVQGVRLHYRERGSGPETIVFSHGLLFDGTMFDAQVAALATSYRCIAYDHRGQGRSDVPRHGYDMESLTDDAEALIDALEAWPCHFCGLSMGGFVGMRLALRHRDRVRSLTLMETSADPEPAENAPRYRRMSLVARWFGMGLVVDRVVPILFGRDSLDDPTVRPRIEAWKASIRKADRAGIHRAVRGVIEREGLHDRLGEIACPTLVIVGDQDIATVPEKAGRIHAGIPGSRLVTISGAGHSSCLEKPDAVTRALTEFLGDIVPPR